jgi:site-specific DNA-methyltransferase (adenine-specific)
MNMDNVFRVPSGAPYFEDESSILLCADTFRTLSKLKESSVDMIFADPPYFLSNDGITCQAGKMVSVNKAEWDEGKTAVARHRFNRRWLAQCYQVLRPNGTIWISGTLHSIYSVGMALEQEGYKVLNNITWQKTNPPPNLACRCFTHSTETILWAKKNCRGNRHVFNYVAMKEMNGGKQMKDVWTGSLTQKAEKAAGHHPTQKPEYLLERVVLASTQPGSIVLDPFCGSGTTGVAAKRLGRYFIGIDNVSRYIEISRERMGQIQWPETSMRG